MYGQSILGNYLFYKQFYNLYRWINGRYGVGKRISFTDSLKMIDAINDGALDNSDYYVSKIFNFNVPNHIPGISD